MKSESAVVWSEKDAAHYRNTAKSLFRHSYDHASPDPDNCGACALLDTSDPDGPNYAGWGRVYVESGRPIPEVWRDAFSRELNSDNKPYANALATSLATFGHPGFIS